ncbi:MAG: glycosyltransferase, partial [Actinomycetota bacterium]|nr:glycosyltransferase [Actinomycetota bacterium]
MAPNEPTWVGEIDRLAPSGGLRVDSSYRAARLLVTVAGTPQGQVTVPLTDGHAPAAVIDEACAALGPADAVPGAPVSDEPVTVVIATRNRPSSLGRCLRSVLAGDHPAIRVVVVD